MAKPTRYEGIVGQLSEREVEKYALGDNGRIFVQNVNRPIVAGLIDYRPDMPLTVDKLDNLDVIEGIVGLMGGGRSKIVKIFYDPTGETLQNVPSNMRVAFTAPQAFEGAELGIEKGVAVLAENVDQYLPKYKK